ncbi:PGAM-domain-containing protein [Ceraceosorus guamensis]|uniref:PGAM-domain-containing protein n=1 Tax=Ceraceosorus guamensis TaxID=1522189 RepID=A0A316W260_9BASI|nr:PGAM-domain-containing protein [Ceraceosorus guamensis]PWN43832.1 PGAM-domain-containing protein [Ceraceosorus guamensis]
MSPIQTLVVKASQTYSSSDFRQLAMLYPIAPLFATLLLVARDIHALGGLGLDRAAALKSKGKALVGAGNTDELRVHFFRHQQTHANVLKVSQGVHEHEGLTTLTDKGREDARRLGHHLSTQGQFKTIYHSPMLRAKQTAEEMQGAMAEHGQHVKLVPLEQIRTLDRGKGEGLPLKQLTEDAKAGKVHEGQETHEAQNLRLHQGLHHIIKASQGEKNTAFIGHYHSVSSTLADVFAKGGARKPSYIPPDLKEAQLKDKVWIKNGSHSVVSIKPSKVADQLDKDGKMVFDPETIRIEKWGELLQPDGKLAHPQIKPYK